MTATNMTIIRCHVYWKFVLVTPTTQWVFFTDRHSRFLPQSRTENLRGFRFQLRWCCMRCIREETCNEHDMCNEHDSNDSCPLIFFPADILTTEWELNLARVSFSAWMVLYALFPWRNSNDSCPLIIFFQATWHPMSRWFFYRRSCEILTAKVENKIYEKSV